MLHLVILSFTLLLYALANDSINIIMKMVHILHCTEHLVFRLVVCAQVLKLNH